jgi:uncharacterized membrane protein
MTDDKLTRMLGWASVGLGAPLLLAPAGSARAIGVDDGPRQRAALAGVGARELTAAAGLLGTRSPIWLWARVAGDLMDLALLSDALRNRTLTARVVKTALKQQDRKGLGRTVAATAAVAAITGIDSYAAITRSRRSSQSSQSSQSRRSRRSSQSSQSRRSRRSRREAGITLTATVTVTRPRQEVYAHWRQLENLPDFMTHLDHVTTTGPRGSHWRASAPFGKTVEWEARITDDIPGERIAWRSLDDSAISNEGDVRFTQAPEGPDAGPDTEVHVKLRYSMPGGRLGEALARYFGEDPHQQLDDDLRRFKQVLETGEVVRSEGAPGGKRARQEFLQHPARPLSAKELAEVRS